MTNQKLIVITDQQENNNWLEELTNELGHHKIKQSRITSITPYYQGVTTIIQEYKKEQANFDTASILEYLSKT